MQLKLVSSFLLFFGSYFPLSLILLIRDITEKIEGSSFCNFFSSESCEAPYPAHPIVTISFFCFTGICFLIFFIFQKEIEPKSEAIASEITLIPSDLVNYTLPYIVTFISLDLSKISEIVATAAFFIFMFLLSYKSGEIMMNPIFLLLDWKFYEVDGEIDGKKTSFKAFSKSQIESGENVKSRAIQQVYVLFKK